MGIYNRDYYREGPPPGSGGGYSISGSPNRGIITIAIINAVVFLMQKSIGYGGPGREAVTNALSLNLYDMQTFQVWRLITYGQLDSWPPLTYSPEIENTAVPHNA